MTRDRFHTARALALLIPVALLGGAYAFQYIGHLYPCEMCWWQRYPHIAGVVLAALAFAVPGRPARATLVALAAVAILVSGLIGAYHAGVEYHWWAGMTACTSIVSGPITLDSIMAAPLVRCDVPQWTFLHISLAGFNAIFSTVGAALIFTLLRERRT